MRRALFFSALVSWMIGTAHAAFPEQPITIVVPYAQGGPTDLIARPLAQALGRELGSEIRLAFQGGEGATRAPRELLQSAARDGYTLLLHNIGMASAPTLYRRLGFSPQKDFAPIGLIADAPMMLLARRELPPATGAELPAHIRQHEKSMIVAYGGPGGAGHLCGLMLEAALQVRLTWIPYTGTGPALDDLARRRADLLCDQTTNATRAVRAQAVKVYALAAPQRLPALPDVPTTGEIGLSGVQISVWHGLYAPSGTPAPVLERLAAALQKAVVSEPFVAEMTAVGALPAEAAQATPQALRRRLSAETQRWRPLIVRSGQFAD